MTGFLFSDIVFGPVNSRRLGSSLGINLLPSHAKICAFNCLYCECGWTFPDRQQQFMFPEREEVAAALEERLAILKESSFPPDALTFAGNGEPTLHPLFPEIVEDTIRLRDRYFPAADVAILSNASMIHKESIFEALLQVDKNILKLDAATEGMFRKINQPSEGLHVADLIRNLSRFNGKVIIQTLFFKGETERGWVDNTAPEEVAAWIDALKQIRPASVMIYPIARATPARNLVRIPETELEEIRKKVEAAGIAATVYH
ncbi:MAG: radical SAM protein [Bacteroidetes bacterium]|nr:radical SAM protein [Bacteroidota bacterium]